MISFGEGEKQCKPSKGVLCRGVTTHNVDKVQTASIPSKFVTVFSQEPHVSKKELGNKCYKIIENFGENPGPGHYIDPAKASNSSFKLHSDSFSKKGYGNGFISNTKRFPVNNCYPYQVPGPGSYDQNEIGKTLNFNFKRVRASPAFIKPTQQIISKETSLLGPGSYEVSRSFIRRGKYQSVSPPRVNALRFLPSKNEISPGPGEYETESKGKSMKSKFRYKGTVSFKSASKLKLMKLSPLVFLDVPNEEEVTPGPGQYSVNYYSMSRNNKQEPKIGSSMFVPHEILDRFGKVRPELKYSSGLLSLGSEQYYKKEIKKFSKLKKSKSGTKLTNFQRDIFIERKRGPGPAFYKLKPIIVKKTKNINPTNDWI